MRNNNRTNRTAWGLVTLLWLGVLCGHAHAELLRIGAWNTFIRPNDATHEAAFSTVFDAIGDTVIGGHAGRIDLLAVSETDPGSAAQLPVLLNNLYSVESYEVITSSSDDGSDRTGFVYDTDALDLIGTSELTVDDGLKHNILRGQFRPNGTAGGLDLYAYAIHLESGASTSNKTNRAAEAALIRADADALGDGIHVIFLGDFNWHSSSEGAWANVTAAGTGQAFDVAGHPASGATTQTSCTCTRKTRAATWMIDSTCYLRQMN